MPDRVRLSTEAGDDRVGQGVTRPARPWSYREGPRRPPPIALPWSYMATSMNPMNQDQNKPAEAVQRPADEPEPFGRTGRIRPTRTSSAIRLDQSHART